MELSDDTGSEKDVTEVTVAEANAENTDKTESSKDAVTPSNEVENVDEVQAAVSVIEKEIESANKEGAHPKENEQIIEPVNLLDNSIETDASEVNKKINDDVMETEERSPSVEKVRMYRSK